MAAGKRWTRDELLIALNFYHKLTFGQLHARQPVIVALAGKLGRGANSVAMKLCNFASLDPALKLRGIRGLEGASALDRAVWEEFHADLNEAVPASEPAVRVLFGVGKERTRSDPQEGRESPPGSAFRVDGGIGDSETTSWSGVFSRCRYQQQRWSLQRDWTGRARIARSVAHLTMGHIRSADSMCAMVLAFRDFMMPLSTVV